MTEPTTDPENGEKLMKLTNPTAAVNTSNDRKKMLSAFDRWTRNTPAQPIEHPAWIGEEEDRSAPGLPFPLLAKRRKGSGAKGQVLCHTPADLRQFRRWRDWRTHGPFWENYVLEEWRPSPREYRVHIVNTTKIIGVDWKQPRDPDTATTDDPKTSALYRFVSLDPKSLQSDNIRKQARRAMRATGLKMGAVDVGYDPLTRTAWVYETNARPGVERPALIAAYVAAGAPEPEPVREETTTVTAATNEN